MVARDSSATCPTYAAQAARHDPGHDKHHAIFSGAAIFVLLKAFANGGSSLTGLEAISNGVSAFKQPEGPQRPPHPVDR